MDNPREEARRQLEEMRVYRYDTPRGAATPKWCATCWNIGADVNAKDDTENRTALQLAEERGHQDGVGVFKAAAAKQTEDASPGA